MFINKRIMIHGDRYFKMFSKEEDININGVVMSKYTTPSWFIIPNEAKLSLIELFSNSELTIKLTIKFSYELFTIKEKYDTIDLPSIGDGSKIVVGRKSGRIYVLFLDLTAFKKISVPKTLDPIIKNSVEKFYKQLKWYQKALRLWSTPARCQLINYKIVDDVLRSNISILDI